MTATDPTAAEFYAAALAASLGGNVAAGAADSGNPVKVGGKYLSTLPNLTDGQRGDAQLNSKGDLLVGIHGGGGLASTIAAVATPGDAVAYTSSLVAIVHPHVFNGTNADRQRTPTVFKSLAAVVITSETTIWTPAGGKKFRLMGYHLTSGVVGGTITLKDNTGGTTILLIPSAAVATHIGPVWFGNGILSAAANNVLTAQGASTETLSGYVFGTEE